MWQTGKISYRIPVYRNTGGYVLEQSAVSASTAMATSLGGMNPASSPPVLIREGEYVSAGQTVFTIYQSGGLVAEFSLHAEDAAHIGKHTKISIHRPGEIGRASCRERVCQYG